MSIESVDFDEVRKYIDTLARESFDMSGPEFIDTYLYADCCHLNERNHLAFMRLQAAVNTLPEIAG